MVDNADTLIEDTAAPPSSATGSGSGRKAFSETIASHTEDLREQAGTKAREYATQGKEKTAEALEGVAKFVEDAAANLNDKLGGGIGDYAQRAADAISGFTNTLRTKDVSELFEDARASVKRNPAIAIGAAAAVGFVVARLIRAAGGTSADTGPSAEDIRVDR